MPSIQAIGACRYLIRHALHFRECLYLMFCKNGVKTFAFFFASFLDCDDTNVNTHGAQELTIFNSY